jgi:hypothetical protein
VGVTGNHCSTIRRRSPLVLWLLHLLIPTSFGLEREKLLSGVNVSIGNGVYKSTDGGKTWKHMDWKKLGGIGGVAIDPRRSRHVFCGSRGTRIGLERERVSSAQRWRKTWEQVFCGVRIRVVRDCHRTGINPRILFAGMWAPSYQNLGREGAGSPKREVSGAPPSAERPGKGWKRVFPAALGKVGLAIAPTNPDVVYALIETGSPNRAFCGAPKHAVTLEAGELRPYPE